MLHVILSLPDIWHVHSHYVHGLIPLTLVNDQLPLPAFEEWDRLVSLIDILRLLQHGKEASADHATQLKAVCYVDGLAHAEHGKHVSAKHAQLSRELPINNSTTNDRRYVRFVTEANVE